MGFGQKILGKLGLEDLKHQADEVQSRLPGLRVINTDERVLSSEARGTYPRATRMGDGSLLAAFSRNDGPNKVLGVSKSTDNGQSFHDFGIVTSVPGGDVDNCFILEVGPGVVLAAFRNHDIGPNGPTHFRITVCRSTDGGHIWGFASQAFEKGAPNGVWEPFMRIGRQGEVQLTYSHEFAHNNQCSMMVRSFDQGSTWSPPQCLGGENELLRDGMTGIAETWDNGRPALVMVFETTRHGPFNVEALISYDDGNSWSWRQEIYRPPPGHNAGAPQIASLPDGALAVIFMTDEDGEVEWPRKAAVKVVFSGPPVNGQMTWTKPSVVCPAVAHWPGIIRLDERNFLAMYEYGGPRAKTITWQY